MAQATVGLTLRLTQSYAISSTLSIGCNVSSTANSAIVPTGGFAGDAVHLVYHASIQNTDAIFGTFSGFTSGAAITLSSVVPVWKVHANLIDLCSIGFYLNGGGGDFTFGEITRCTTAAFKVSSGSNVVQGVNFYCGFATNCANGMIWDGSANCNANSCLFASYDSDTYSSGSVFYNSGGSTLQQWTLGILDWGGNGGPSGPTLWAGWFASGAFSQCKFILGNTNASRWDLLTLTSGSTFNSFETSIRGGASAVTANWQVATNNRGSFGPSPSSFIYANSVYCAGTILSSIPAGGSTTIYVYSPFAASQVGNAWNFRVSGPIGSGNLSASQGSGLVCTQIFDNSATHANELILTITNVSSTATSSSTPYAFFLNQGMPGG